MQHVNLLLSEWVGGALSNLVFVSYFYASYYEILAFPAGYCHLARGCASLLAVFFKYIKCFVFDFLLQDFLNH